MRRLFASSIFCVLISLAPAFAGPGGVGHGKPTVISVGKHGKISVDHQPIRQKDLLTSLARLGVTSASKIAVEGDEGVSYKDISRVMETLASAGLLPPGAID